MRYNPHRRASWVEAVGGNLFSGKCENSGVLCLTGYNAAPFAFIAGGWSAIHVGVSRCFATFSLASTDRAVVCAS